MKNKMALVAFAVFAGATSSAMAADGICALITAMQDVFKTLRVLAFLGAGFILANWAWDFIKGGDGKDGTLDMLKKKGISMLVGFALLFSVGIVLSFLMNGNLVDCAGALKTW